MEKYALIARKDACCLILNGELGVEQADRIKSGLLEGLEAADRLLLDLAGAGEISLAALQLICAAHKSAAARGKQIVLDGRPPENLRQAVSDAGFERKTGCFVGGADSCLWSWEGNRE